MRDRTRVRVGHVENLAWGRRTIGGPLVELSLHKPTGQVFVAVEEQKDSGDLSKEAHAVLQQLRSLLEAAASPATVRETGNFGEIIQRIGEDVHSRCHDET